MARPTKAQRVEIAERRAKNVALRLTGKSWSAIADELGYSSTGAACQDFGRALEANLAEQRRGVEMYREETLRAIELLMVEAWMVLRRDHITVSHGRVIRDDDTGEKILDDGPTLQAMDRIARLLDQRSKLRGEYAPVKVEAITIDALDQAIAALAAELEEQPASPVE
jgi:hypothetical protein